MNQPSRRDFLRGHFASVGLVDESSTVAPSFLHFTRRAMGCGFVVFVPAEQGIPHDNILSAMDCLEEIEAWMSIYRHDSEVSLVNRIAAERSTTVSAHLGNLLRRCQQLHQRTEGAFDVASGALSDLWGFTQRNPAVPPQSEVDELLTRAGIQNVKLHADQHEVQFAGHGPKLNFGSIGKGYALDEFSRRMTHESEWLIHAGFSSILCRTGESKRRWRVDLQCGRESDARQIVANFHLSNCAMATAGQQAQSLLLDGKQVGHILDPRTGYPADGCSTATAFAASAADADAFATAFLILGPEAVAEICRREKQLGAILVAREESVWTVHRIGKLPNSTRWNQDLRYVDHR